MANSLKAIKRFKQKVKWLAYCNWKQRKTIISIIGKDFSIWWGRRFFHQLFHIWNHIRYLYNCELSSLDSKLQKTYIEGFNHHHLFFHFLEIVLSWSHNQHLLYLSLFRKQIDLLISNSLIFPSCRFIIDYFPFFQ